MNMLAGRRQQSQLSSAFARLFRREEEENKELANREKGLLRQLLDLSISRDDPPESQVNTLEQLISTEQESLTFEERERAAFDVHGLAFSSAKASGGAEAPTLVEQTKLVDMDNELKRLKMDMTNPLVKSEEFRLMFLRCDDLDVKVAAQRLCKNFDIKREMFGHACMHREIQYSDLSPDDLKVLESGMCRVSPNRDSAGRLVLFHRPTLKPAGVNQKSVFRAIYYNLSQLSKQADVQRRGMVIVALFTSIPSRDRREAFKALRFMRRMKAGVPRKISAVHFCVDTSSCNTHMADEHQRRMFTAAAQLICRPDVRTRFRTHVGIKETIEFQLSAYGINLTQQDWPGPIPAALAAQDGKPAAKKTNIDNSENTASTADGDDDSVFSAGSQSLSILVPCDQDVLFGRGKHTRNHPGNLRAMQLVNQYREQYEKAKKFEKTAIAERIVQMIASTSGRFLKYENDQWVQVDSQTARNKISHLYRNTRNKVSISK